MAAGEYLNLEISMGVSMRGTPSSNRLTPPAAGLTHNQRRGQRTAWLQGLEIACIKSSSEGNGSYDVNIRVFFFFKRPQWLSEGAFLILALGISRQQEERFWEDGLKDTSKGASQENQRGLFFFFYFKKKVHTQRRACNKKAFKRSLPKIKSFFSFS